MLAIGAPIEVGPACGPADPSLEQRAVQLLERVEEAVQDLYNRRAKMYGWHDRPLVIV